MDKGWEAYSTEGWSQAAIWVNASKLASNAKVSLWLAYLKATQITEALYTKEAHILDMAEAARACKENKAWSAYVKAIESRREAEQRLGIKELH